MRIAEGWEGEGRDCMGLLSKNITPHVLPVFSRNFSLYIFCVIIYVIIYCYHDIYIMKNYNILYTQKGQHLKNDNILYNQKDSIKEFKNDYIYTIENDNILYTQKL